MIKQIRRGVAITILVGMTTLNVFAIGSGSDKATIQNSTLNEQVTVDVETPSLESVDLGVSQTPCPPEEETILEVESESASPEENEKDEVGAPQEQVNPLFYELTDKEWEYLYRTARCEAGNWCKNYTECGECEKCAQAKQGQKNVVYVILNRLHNDRFPKTIEGIIFAKRQFSVTTSKKFYTVELTDTLKANVQEAVKDWQPGVSAQGALYFNSISKNYWDWAEFLFEDEVGHYFFKSKNGD